MASIFKALEGAHLDRALFGRGPARAKTDPRRDDVVQAYASRGRRLFRLSQTVSEIERRKTDTEPGS